MKRIISYLLLLLPVCGSLPAQTVDKVICSGTSFIISPATDAIVGYTYRWLENGMVISGATAANYTIPSDKPVGVYTYIRRSTSADNSHRQDSDAYTVSVGHKPGSTTTMQEFVPCGYTANSTWVLTDVRPEANGQTYTVRYLADGRFWMVDDLKYPTACNKTNFSNRQSAGSIGAKIPGFYGDCHNITDGSIPASRGYLYDWMFVMQHAEAYYGSRWNPECTGNPGDKAVCRGICPEGWHVPTGNPGSGEFTRLNKAVNGGSMNSDAGLRDTNMFSAVYGGHSNNTGSLYGQGSTVHYWSSSYNNTYFAYLLHFNSSSVNPVNYNYKNYGYAVRCVRNY